MKKFVVPLFVVALSLCIFRQLSSATILTSQYIWRCKYLTCTYLSFTFYDFHRHTQKHIKESQGVCWVCTKTFPEKLCNFSSHMYQLHYSMPQCPFRKKSKVDAVCKFPITSNHIIRYHSEFIDAEIPMFFACNLCKTVILIDCHEVKLIFQHCYSHFDPDYQKIFLKKFLQKPQIKTIAPVNIAVFDFNTTNLMDALLGLTNMKNLRELIVENKKF